MPPGAKRASFRISVGTVGIAAAGGQDAEQEAGDRQQRRALRVADAARDVTLRHVRQLVCQHRGELVGVGRQREQSQVHAHVTAGPREGVDGPVAHQEHLPGELALEIGVDVTGGARGGQQRLPEALHVGQQHRVVEEVGVAPSLAQDLLADALLVGHRQVDRGRLAQRRKHRGLGTRRHGRAGERDAGSQGEQQCTRGGRARPAGGARPR